MQDLIDRQAAFLELVVRNALRRLTRPDFGSVHLMFLLQLGNPSVGIKDITPTADALTILQMEEADSQKLVAAALQHLIDQGKLVKVDGYYKVVSLLERLAHEADGTADV